MSAYQSTDEVGNTWRGMATAIAWSLLLLTLWTLTHRYHGLSRDGELYAVQAMARVHPWLNSDLYLQNTSQDHYTFFSPIYAWLIGIFGLRTAELLLFSSCTVWFLAAAWHLARELSTTEEAWLSAALLIITVGYYGAYQIFSYSEDYLTARSMGEALVVTALACHFRGRRPLSIFIATAALLIHPLMALPGVLLLMCLWLPIRAALMGAMAALLATLVFALTAPLFPAIAKFATVMDPAWAEIVRERSQFLFLKYWGFKDWEIAARPFVCLTLTAMAFPDERTRKICLGAMLVGALGLAVAFIASAIGPVAILIQGQAWRWMWITGFTSVVLLAPTAWRVWQEDKGGPLCATLLVLGWTYSGIEGLTCSTAALILWLVRAHITGRAALYLKWAAGGLGAILATRLVVSCWTFFSAPIPETGREPLGMARIRGIFGLEASALLLVGIFWYWMRRFRAAWAMLLASALLLATSVWILSASIKQSDTVGTPAEIDDFADWHAAIPPASNVLMVPTTKSAAFMWFTLERPSYLSLDQSAGVVFSRTTSLEVRRRSQVLLPLTRPDWKILSRINAAANAGRNPGSTKAPVPSQALTAKILMGICTDPELGFVIARESVGFDPLRHTHVGNLMDWNLYDCRRVRSAPPAT